MTWPHDLERPAVSARRHLHPLPNTVRPCSARQDPLFHEHPVADVDDAVSAPQIVVWCVAGTIGWAVLVTSGWLAFDLLRRL